MVRTDNGGQQPKTLIKNFSSDPHDSLLTDQSSNESPDFPDPSFQFETYERILRPEAARVVYIYGKCQPQNGSDKKSAQNGDST